MADFNQPALTSLYADMVNVLKDRDISALKWLDGTTDNNIPTGAKRWNDANSYFEKFNGTTWSALAAKYMIDVDKLDGCTVNDLGTSTTDLWTASKITSALSTKLDSSAYTATDVLTKIKTVDGATSGLDADLLDGLHAASTNTVSTVVARDSSGNFSAGTITANLTGTASTATTLTGLTSTVAELNYADGVTSNIQTQLNGKLGSTAQATDSALLNGVASAETATASTIVKRTSAGYIYAAAFRSTLADTATAATHYYVETGSDGWLRPKPLANVKAELLASAALSGTPTAPTAAVGTNTTQVATTAFVKANSISGGVGIGQTWTDVTASRALGTTYTNSTGEPIGVYVSKTNTTNTAYTFTVSGLAVGYVNGYGTTNGVFFIVPNGGTYSVSATAGALSTWRELR